MQYYAAYCKADTSKPLNVLIALYKVDSIMLGGAQRGRQANKYQFGIPAIDHLDSWVRTSGIMNTFPIPYAQAFMATIGNLKLYPPTDMAKIDRNLSNFVMPIMIEIGVSGSEIMTRFTKRRAGIDTMTPIEIEDRRLALSENMKRVHEGKFNEKLVSFFYFSFIFVS